MDRYREHLVRSGNAPSIVSTPWLQGGLVIFGNFPLEGAAGKFLVCRDGAPKSRGGAEDFDKFCKNVIEKFSKIK